MSKQSQRSCGQAHPQLSAGGLIVCKLNARGAICLWSPKDGAVHILRGRNVKPDLRNEFIDNIAAVIVFLETQARELVG